MSSQTKLIPAEKTALICIICKCLLESPFQSVCGCRACRDCWENYLVDDYSVKMCPGNTSECQSVSFTMNNNSKLRVDPAARRDTLLVKIFCTNRNDGCEKILLSRELENHLNKECLFNTTHCWKCDKMILQIHLQEHKTNCEMEVVNCEFCNEQVTRIDLNTTHNNLSSEKCCQLYRGACPYCNYFPLDVRKIVKHREKYCEKWIFPCGFKSVGCSFTGPRDVMKQHEKDDGKMHQQLICISLTQTETQINQAQTDIKSISISTSTLLNNTKMSKEIFLEAERFNSQSMPPSRQTTPPASQTITSRNGLFIWKIRDVKSKMSTAQLSPLTFLTSEPFYSSTFGYKMCLRIYLHGDGAATGQYISCFLVIMKGKYDDILTWPMANKVTLSLLDQSGRNNDHSHVFRPDTNSPCFSRPVAEQNTASGIPNFFLLNSLPDSRYLQNDTIYVKARIHPANY